MMSRPGKAGVEFIEAGREPIARWLANGALLTVCLILCAREMFASAPEPTGSPPQQQASGDEPADATAPEGKVAPPRRAAPVFPGNPLEKLVRRIFNPRGPILPLGRKPAARVIRNRQADGSEEGQATNSADRDAIDARAPQDAKIEHQLRAAQAAVKQRDWKRAVPLLQNLLDLSEDSMHRLPDKRWQSVRVTATRLLGEAPPEVLNEYQQQNGGLAQQLFSEARRDGDVNGVAAVATRYFHTQAGHQAADWLAVLHQDHAEFGMASLWIEELLRAHAPLARAAAWRLKAAGVSQQAGRPELVQQLLAGLPTNDQNVRVHAESIAVGEWLKSLKPTDDPPVEIEVDWRMMNGTAGRLGMQTGSAPFLRPLWHAPFSSNHDLRQRIEWLIEDLVDQNRPTLLMTQPLAVNGKVIYRDLRGVHTVDLQTGRSIWESMEGMSAERILTGTAGNSPFDGTEDAIQTPNSDLNDPFSGHQAEFHPLTNLLLRDAAYNILSSDGRQVFLLEDHGILSRQQPGMQWGWDGEEDDPYGFSWTTNRLSSYDVETGRLLWTVGGPETSELFQLPLAGVYFHGAPTPDRDDLFVIGSRGEELRLWCLDRLTGGVNWSQLIAFADAKIDQDVGRRWMAALPSVSQGIVVCPTALGWLVAVDRLRHSVLWATRYSPPGPGAEGVPGANLVPQRELGEAWGPAAPIIAGRSVLFTPAEDDHLVCFDLITGERRWQLDREQGQYLLGVREGRVFVVQLNSVAAHSLADGKTAWSLAFKDGAQPSGRGILTDQQLYIPLNNGELLVTDLEGGAVQRMALPEGEAPLGNLVMHQGMVAALGSGGLTAFRQQATLWTDIQQRKKKNPQDPEALLSEAEIHLVNRQPEQALAELRRISWQELPARLQPRAHADLVQGLTAVIRERLADSEQELAEFGRVADSQAERLLHLDLSAERLLALKRHREAFELYWQLTAAALEGVVTRREDSKILVAGHAWLQGRLRDVWTAANAEDRAAIDARILAAVLQAPADNPAARRRLADSVRFHPSALPLVQSLVEARWKSGDLAGTELELIRLSESDERATAAWAHWKLGTLMEELGLAEDAAVYYRRLERDFASDMLPSGGTGAEVVNEIRRQQRVSLEPRVVERRWSDRPLRAVQSIVQSYGPPEQEVALESPLPFFHALDVEFLPQEQRLRFHSRTERGNKWLAPLRTSAHGQHHNSLSATTIGHAVAVIHQDVLQMLSPAQKKTLWSLPLTGSGEGGMGWQQSARPRYFFLWNLTQDFEGQWPLIQQPAAAGRLAVGQPGYLAVHGRRTVHILDPLTGDELWRRDHVLPQTKVVGGPDAVWIIPPDASRCRAYRVTDGAPLNIAEPGKLLSKTVCFVENDLLLAEQGTGGKLLSIDRSRTVLRRHDPLQKSDVWKHEFIAKTVFSLLVDEELLVVQPDGVVELVETRSGQRRALESLTAKDLQGRAECYAVVDDERLFLIINQQDSAGFHNFGESLPSVRVSGTMCAWQLNTGKLLWKQPLSKQHLILDHFRSSPVLLFCTREWKTNGNVNFSLLNLLAVDKQSGKQLHESSLPTMHNSFHSVAVFPEEHSVELKAYNLRVKLAPADDSAAAR